MPLNLSRYENEKVVLTCNISVLNNGNSPCSTFIWTNNKDFYETFIDTSELTFLMKEHYQGSYRCKCENEYGMSEESAEAEISFLNSTSLSKVTFYVVGIIGIVLHLVNVWPRLQGISHCIKGCRKLKNNTDETEWLQNLNAIK